MSNNLNNLDVYIDEVNEAYYEFAIYLFEMRGRSGAEVVVNEYNSLIVFQFIFSVCMMLEEYNTEIMDEHDIFLKEILEKCPVGNKFDTSVISDILSKGNIYKKCYHYCKVEDGIENSIFWAELFIVACEIPNFSTEIIQKANQLYYDFLYKLEKCIVQWIYFSKSVSETYCTQLTTAFNDFLYSKND